MVGKGGKRRKLEEVCCRPWGGKDANKGAQREKSKQKRIAKCAIV